MTKRKDEHEPSVATYGDHEVITPPQQAAQGVATGARPATTIRSRAPKQALARALGRIRRPGWTPNASGSTPRAATSKANGFTEATRRSLFHAAHDIKGEAATFGYPAVAARRRQPVPADRAHAGSRPHPARAGRPACRCGARHHPRA